MADRQGVDDLRGGRGWRRVETGWYILLSALCLVVILFAGLATASVQPAFCGLCHQDHYQELAASRHADQHCDSCHTAGSASGLVASRLSVARMAISWVVPGGSKVEAYVGNDRCLLCHLGQMEETKVSNGLAMNHAALVKEQWSCTNCHATVAHGRASSRKTGYNMDMCLPCHSTNPKNPGTCQTCHPDGAPDPTQVSESLVPQDPPEKTYTTPYRATHGADVRSTHGMGDLKTCAACHSQEHCTACHQSPIPHPDNFMRTHGRLALQNKTDCLTCHRQETCDNCHQVPMPHPEGFLQSHAATARDEDVQRCYRCHDESKSCTACHIQHTHPGVPRSLLDRLRANPVR